MSDLLDEAQELASSMKFDEALAKYDEAIAADAANPLAYVEKGSVLKALGRYKECIACFDAAIRVLDGWKVSEDDGERLDAFYAMLLVLKAEAHLYMNEADLAFSALDKADFRHGSDAASLVIRAQAHMLQKEYEEAGNCFYQAEEWCFRNDDAMLSQIWRGKLDLAHECKTVAPAYGEKVYKEGWYRKPLGEAADLFERANKVRDEGLLFDAMRFYDAALGAGFSDRALVFFFKGMLYEKLKRWNEAYSLYSDALKAGPSSADEFNIRVRWANAKAMMPHQ
ncbi:MAG TPA: hypothetical protein O0X39_00555 [Methanocorpusculum sp.]|nr:hypothetical protein [Methanocorpusculum sp.]